MFYCNAKHFKTSSCFLLIFNKQTVSNRFYINIKRFLKEIKNIKRIRIAKIKYILYLNKKKNLRFLFLLTISNSN